MRSFPIDWKMVLGFGGILFLIAAIGLVGVGQIESLSRVVAHLARIDIPLQNAVQDMKSSNSRYATGIRNYIFWKSAKYLEAASVAEKNKLMKSATEAFDRGISYYVSAAASPETKEWVRTLRLNEAQLRAMGDEIMASADAADGVASAADKKEIEENISTKLMDFESKLYQIEGYLDDPIQKRNLVEIDRQLSRAEADRARSVALLAWSLLVALSLGAWTAFLTYRRAKRDSEHRELLCRTVIKVEEEEKNNLSMQIHDQMGQDLSALKIYLSLIERDLSAEQNEQRDRIDKTKKILDALMAKAHNISEILRPPELDDLGLIESVGALILQYEELTGCRIGFTKPEHNQPLSPEYALVLYRVVQEALTNVAKYSKAKNVEVALKFKGSSVSLAVIDDGTGFDYGAYLKKPARRKDDKAKLGLQGLKERIELFGGRLSIESKPDRGTRLSVEMPAF
jgi:signal transduction histidine kinase